MRNEGTLFLPIFLGSLGVLLVYFLDSGSNPESGPNSPPTVNNSQASPTAESNTAIQEVSFNNIILSSFSVIKIYYEMFLIYYRKVKIQHMEDVSLAAVNKAAFLIFRFSVHRPCLTSR